MLHFEDLGDLLGYQVQTETLFNDQIWENRAWNEIPRNRDRKTLNQKKLSTPNDTKYRDFKRFFDSMLHLEDLGDLLGDQPLNSMNESSHRGLQRSHGFNWSGESSNISIDTKGRLGDQKVWLWIQHEWLGFDRLNPCLRRFKNPCPGHSWTGNGFRSSIKRDAVIQHAVSISGR